jgi:hypothetical protein
VIGARALISLTANCSTDDSPLTPVHSEIAQPHLIMFKLPSAKRYKNITDRDVRDNDVNSAGTNVPPALKDFQDRLMRQRYMPTLVSSQSHVIHLTPINVPILGYRRSSSKGSPKFVYDIFRRRTRLYDG